MSLPPRTSPSSWRRRVASHWVPLLNWHGERLRLFADRTFLLQCYGKTAAWLYLFSLMITIGCGLS
eukprot:1468173-Pyramimonas_sp.AAC.1